MRCPAPRSAHHTPWLQLVALVVTLSASGTAAAHGSASGGDSRRQAPALDIQSTFEQASFHVNSRRGEWSRLRLSSTYRPVSWLAVGANLPLGWVREEGREEAVGLGDIVVRVGGRLRAADSLELELEADLELPTGSPDDGLGAGHMALTPALRSTWWIDESVSLEGALAVSTVLGGHSHGAQSWHSAFAIHSMLELSARFVARLHTEAGGVGIGLTTIQGLADPREVGPSSVHLEGALYLGAGFRVTGEFELPFAGRARTGYRVGLGVGWSLASDEHIDCGCDDRCEACE